jgi:two-component sensor histidine kinase
MVSAGFFTNDARLRGLAGKFKSEGMEELANKFHARSGADDATGRDYHMASMRAATSRTQRAYEALENVIDDKVAMSRVRDLLTNPNGAVRAKPAEVEAARAVSKLLKETIDYRKDAGESIGEVTEGYFPRILDNELVVKGRDKFLAAAEKLYRGIGAPDAKASADAWYERIFDSYSGLDGGLDHVSGANGGIGTSTSKAREFGKQADVLLKDFYNQDTFGTLAAYFTGSAKRAEYNRRFGKPGREGSPERLKWEKEHGDKNQMQELFGRIKAEVKASGEDASDYQAVLESVMKSNLGQMGTKNPFARNAISYLHAWNQLGKMDRSMVTSLGELTMGFIRGGPKYGFTFMKDSVGEFGRQLAKADPSDSARWAEALGISNDAMVNQVLTSRIDAEGSSAGVQKMLAGFYKGIGLHQYTEATRIASVKMGRKFVSDLAHDLKSPKARTRSRASFYLKELGIKDPEAFGSQLRASEPKMQDVLEDRDGIASEYGTALNRFVNQTIMVPSRAEKPTWAGHPVGSLFFSLMSYSYGFKKNVLDRGGRLGIEAFKQKDPALLLPALGLSVMAAFQGLNDTYLRPAIFGSNYDFSKETPTEMMLRVSDRAGLTGALSPFVNAIKAVKYDRSVLESMSGPVVGSLGSAVQKVAIEPFTDRNSPNTNTAERNAAIAFYDAVIDPMTDAFAASRLKGAVRSGVILGTGDKKGGLLFADKDMAIDAMAGEKERWKEQRAIFYEDMANCFAAQKDFANAYSFSGRYQALQDTLLNEENTRHINEMNVLYESEQKQKQIVQLNEDVNKGTMANLQSIKERNYLLLSSLLLLALLAVIFISFRNSRIKSTTLNEQNNMIEKALADKEVLLKEIHHRVKNNMQIVSSLLDLQSISIKDSEAAEAMKDGKNRVQSMALIHQNLYQQDNLKGINAKDYVEQLLMNLKDSYSNARHPVDIKTDIQDLNIDLDTMIPVGLILNELITNVFKYAVPLVQSPRLEIRLAEMNNTLYIKVKDNGPGFAELADIKTAKTFGLKMVRAFAQKLKAKMEVENNQGAIVELFITKYKIV